jgi:hypothetical protein
LLGQNIENYKNLFPHVCAAIQLSMDYESILPFKGDSIKYVYTDAQRSNPLCRVTPVRDTGKEVLRYDKEKYKEMILEGAQSVLGHFGFDRNIYRDEKYCVKAKEMVTRSKITKRKRHQN